MVNKGLIYSCSVLASLLAVFTVYCLFLGYHAGPFRDMWVDMDFIRHALESNNFVSGLFSLHGGAHRLVIPRLLFLLEYGVFNGNNIFLILVGLSAQLGVVWLINQWAKNELNKQDRWFLVCIALALLVNPLQLENFLYTFDVQWFLTAAFAIFSIACWILWVNQTSQSSKKNATIFIAAVLATFVSVFSSFSGVCLLLLLPVLAWVYSRSWFNTLVTIIIIGAIVGLYLQGPFSQASNWIGIKDEVITPRIVCKFVFLLASMWLRWIALYLGSPLSRDIYWLAAILSWGSLVYLACCCYHLARKGVDTFSQLQLLFLFIALFAALVGFATGWGRMYFINTANEDRYQAIAAIYWLGIFGLAWVRANKSEVHWRKPVTVFFIIFWLFVVIPYFSFKVAKDQLNFFDRVNTANLAIATGQWEFYSIKDTLILGDKTKRINRPEKHAGFLQEKGWGVFNTAEAKLLSSTLPELLDGTECVGAISVVEVVGDGYGGYRLAGQAWDIKKNAPIEKLFITNSLQQVMGLGRLQRKKDSLLPVGWQLQDKAQWLGYTQNISVPTEATVWGQLADGYCPIASITLASAKLPMGKS